MAKQSKSVTEARAGLVPASDSEPTPRKLDELSPKEQEAALWHFRRAVAGPDELTLDDLREALKGGE